MSCALVISPFSRVTTLLFVFMSFTQMWAAIKSVASNTEVQNYVRNGVSSIVNRRTESTVSSPETSLVSTKLTDAAFNKLVKQDGLNGFSCYRDMETETTYVILLKQPIKSVWSGREMSDGMKLAKLLNEMIDVTEEANESTRSSKLDSLLSFVSSPRTPYAPIHIASACGFIKTITKLCSRDPELGTNHASLNGLLPLHLAVKEKQLEAVKCLLKYKAPINKGDGNGSTALHIAASVQDSSQIIDILLSTRDVAVDSVDGEGRTPLFVALNELNPLAVSRLISKGANVDVKGTPSPLFALLRKTLSTMKEADQLEECLTPIFHKFPSVLELQNNNTSVLHNVIDKNVLSLILSLAPPSLSLDSLSPSPLSTAVRRKDLDSVLLYLAYNSSPNKPDSTDKTPLQYAVEGGDANIVKALLLFGGNVDAKTKEGRKVSDLSSRAEIALLFRIAQGTNQVTLRKESLSKLDIFQYNRALRSIKGKKCENALSLDGGGIRGLILIELLCELERIVGPSLLSHFTWVAGTSTGAILALAISQGKSIDECRKLYFRFKDRVFFGGKGPYSDKILEKFLRKEFGEESNMRSLKGRNVIVTACDGTVCPAELRLFRSYQASLPPGDLSSLGYEDPSNTKIWYAARCSSAAPTYFSPMENKWMDGGLVSNNPVNDLLQDILVESDAREMNGQPALSLGVVLSLGTGVQKIVNVSAINLEIPSGFFSALKSYETIKHLKNVLVEQICRADGPVVSRAKAITAGKNGAFFRYSPPLEKEIMLDETNNGVLIEMLWNTKLYMQTQSEYTTFLSQILAP